MLCGLDLHGEEQIQHWINEPYEDGDITAGVMNEFVERHHNRPGPDAPAP